MTLLEAHCRYVRLNSIQYTRIDVSSCYDSKELLTCTCLLTIIDGYMAVMAKKTPVA